MNGFYFQRSIDDRAPEINIWAKKFIIIIDDIEHETKKLILFLQCYGTNETEEKGNYIPIYKLIEFISVLNGIALDFGSVALDQLNKL